MTFTQVKNLNRLKFRRATGMSRRTFYLMVNQVKAAENQKIKPGRPCSLSVEDQVLITIQYWREYRTYFHISLDWGVSESLVCRTVHKVEDILIKSKKLALPGQKELREFGYEGAVLVIDVMESPIQRPKKGQRGFYSGKQREHTFKSQVIIEMKTLKILSLRHGRGRTHDFKLFKKTKIKLPKDIQVFADKGFQGMTKIHHLTAIPIKKPRKGELTDGQKFYHRQINRMRACIERVNRCLKIFKILSYPYRNRRKKLGIRSQLIAGIYNNELA